MTPEAVRLHELLATKFTDGGELQQLVAMDGGLAAAKLRTDVNFQQSTGTVAFQLVQVAESRGILPALAEAVLRARPNVQEARDVAALFGVAVGATAADPGKVRFAAGQVTQAFVHLRKRLVRLGIYKALHDVLHQIQRSHRELVRVVQAAREPGYDPLDAGGTPDDLRKWLVEADRPARLPSWVPELVRAVRVVARCANGEPVPAAEADRELEVLGVLPAREQADLNERLVDAARELDTDTLADPLNGLFKALGLADAADFQQKYDQFRRNTADLHRLTDEHDVCQRLDGALAEAIGLARQPASGVAPAWAEVRGEFGRVVDGRPADETVGRLVRMVDRLAAAGATTKDTWLIDLRTGFDGFFFDLDAELLDATDRVLRTAEVLDFRLRGYSQ